MPDPVAISMKKMCELVQRISLREACRREYRRARRSGFSITRSPDDPMARYAPSFPQSTPAHAAANRQRLPGIPPRPPGCPADSESGSSRELHTPPGSAPRKRVLRIPAERICSAIPSTSRSHTARVASGVTSRGAIPVPPVVTTRRAEPAKLNQFFLDRIALVGHQRPPDDPKPAPLQRLSHGRPREINFLAARTRVADRHHRRCHSLAAIARVSCRAGHLRPQLRFRQRLQRRRAAPRRASAVLPSTGPAYSAWSFLCPCSS